MAEGKNQHFIPQYYFRYFNGKGKKINLLRLTSGEIIHGASVRNQASANYFYGDRHVEDALSRLEGLIRGAIHHLITTQSVSALDDPGRMYLRAGVAFQRCRTMTDRQAEQPVADQLFGLQIECAINRMDSGETKDRLRERLKSGELRATSDPEFVQHLSITHALTLGATALSDLKMILLQDCTGTGFLFGDSPVAFYNRAAFEIKQYGVLGYQSCSLQVFYPLGPTLCLFMYDGGVYSLPTRYSEKIELTNRQDVDSLNKLQLYTAGEVAYFGECVKTEYVQRLWQEEGHQLKLVESCLHRAPAISEDGSGEIVHVFRPQVGYRCDLSFVQFAALAGMSAYQVRNKAIIAKCEAIDAAEDKYMDNWRKRWKQP